MAGILFRNDFKVAAVYPMPWQLQAGPSFASYPNGDFLAVNFTVPANLFPGGRTQVVTVNLIPRGTKYLQRWNQMDLSVRRTVRFSDSQVQPTIEVFNLLNAGVALTTLQALGPSLDQPTSTLQGRMLKPGALVKF
jgi:hypothetical protein